MITGVAFCPGPPVLVPEVAQGAAAELDDLRTVCRDAIRRAARPGVQVVVVGAGESSVRHASSARGSLAGFGVDLVVPLGSDAPGPVELPPALTVGAWLLRDALGPGSGAIGWSVAAEPDLVFDPDDRPTALVVMGDGSARRSLKAPGHLDDRAAAFDATIAAILGDGDAASLAGVDLALARELLVEGAPAWHAAAGRLEGEWDAELLYDAAPYGVGYFVATWTPRG